MQIITEIILKYYQSINYSKVLKVYNAHISLYKTHDNRDVVVIQRDKFKWFLANYRRILQTYNHCILPFSHTSYDIFLNRNDYYIALPSNYWYTYSQKSLKNLLLS